MAVAWLQLHLVKRISVEWASFHTFVEMVNVGLHGGDNHVIFLDGEQGRLITQGTLKGGHTSGSTGQGVVGILNPG